MTSRYQKNVRDDDKVAVPTGYEGSNIPDNFELPSCGLEDLDKAVFNLFNKDIPLFYNHLSERKKVPVIFATGERFAILRRKKPLTDANNALILPLISIIRNSIDNKPQKGMSNNMMLPLTIAKRISDKDTAWKQVSNLENIQNALYSSARSKEQFSDYSLEAKKTNNIIEVIEIPPPRYFGASYEVTIWSSFTQQMNTLMETIMSSYTHHPGQQFKIQSDKGYWFPAFIETNISQDASYQDFSDSERFVKYSFNLQATGYIVALNNDGVKIPFRSFKSSPQISFEIGATKEKLSNQPQLNGIVSNDTNAFLLNEIEHEEDFLPGINIGIDQEKNAGLLKNRNPNAQGAAADQRNYIDGVGINSNSEDLVAGRGTSYQKTQELEIINSEGEKVLIQAKNVSEKKGEAVFSEGIAEIVDIFTN